MKNNIVNISTKRKPELIVIENPYHPDNIKKNLERYQEQIKWRKEHSGLIVAVEYPPTLWQRIKNWMRK